MKNFESREYQNIRNAALVNKMLQVEFENGDQIELNIDLVLPFNKSIVNGDLKFTSYEIEIPGAPDDIIIPWDKIRIFTDRDFSKFIANKAEEHAKQVGLKIKRLREKKEIRASDLADRAGLTPQTISRIEKGHTDVGFITLRKILAAMGYNLADLVQQEIEIQTENPVINFEALIKKLTKVGVDKNLLFKKIIPISLSEKLVNFKQELPELLLNEIEMYISKIYGWTLKDIWSNNELKFSKNPAYEAMFKRATNSNEVSLVGYANYAFSLAQIVLKAFPDNPKFEYPEDYKEVQNILSTNYDGIVFKSILNYAWDLGIAVIPLNDVGVFHGAAWNIDDRHVIVIKQNSVYHSRWIFDLLHELYHVFDHLNEPNSKVIEEHEVSPLSDTNSIEEKEANSFASWVLFDGHVEKYAKEALEHAKWEVKNLKDSVSYISNVYKIREDSFANYIAYRLGKQGQQWWGTANTFQISSPSPYEEAVKILKQRVKLDDLDLVERELLSNIL